MPVHILMQCYQFSLLDTLKGETDKLEVLLTDWLNELCTPV